MVNLGPLGVATELEGRLFMFVTLNWNHKSNTGQRGTLFYLLDMTNNIYSFNFSFAFYTLCAFFNDLFYYLFQFISLIKIFIFTNL